MEVVYDRSDGDTPSGRGPGMKTRLSIDVAEFLGKQQEAASLDPSREVVRTSAEALMGADADNVCNATYGEQLAVVGRPERPDRADRGCRAGQCRGGRHCDFQQ